MALYGAYMINDKATTAPDSETWSENVVGETLDMRQKRSPYKTLIWRKNVVDDRYLDWFDYDNTILDSIVTRAPGELKNWVRYTDAICQEVSMVQVHNQGRQVEARFLVNTEA